MKHYFISEWNCFTLYSCNLFTKCL